MKYWMLTVLTFGMLVLAPSKAATPKTCFHLNPLAEQEIGYCLAVRAGNTLYISGITAAGPMPDAIKQVYEDLGKTLKAHGLTFDDVVKENVYSTNLDAFIKHKELRKSFYSGSKPAGSWVQVQQLYVPALVLEVELVAVFPD